MALIFFVITGCNEDHVKPTLVVTVADQNGIPVSNATARLFLTESDYYSGTVKETFTTDAAGKFTSVSADYASGTFHVEVEKDNLITWPATTVKGSTNDYKITLANNNFYHDLIGSQWKLIDVTLAGTSVFSNVSACSKDNYLTFNKNMKVDFNESADICVGQVATVQASFLPPKKEATSLYAFNSQQYYNLSVQHPTEQMTMSLLSTLDKIITVGAAPNGQVINTYKKQ